MMKSKLGLFSSDENDAKLIQNLEDILQLFEIHVRIIGEEYKDTTFTGRKTCAKRGIEIHYNKRDHRFSSTDLRERVYNKELMKDIEDERT